MNNKNNTRKNIANKYHDATMFRRDDIIDGYLNTCYSAKGLPLQSRQVTESELFDEIIFLQRQIRATMNDLLPQELQYFSSKKEMMSADMIDATSLFTKYSAHFDDDKNAALPIPGMLNKEGICKYITTEKCAMKLLPCFEKGVLKLNKKRWLMWETTSLDIRDDGIECKMYLKDFIKTGAGWELNLVAQTTLSDFLDVPNREDSDTSTVHMGNIFDLYTFATYMYDHIDTLSKRYHWGTRERYVLEKVILPATRNNSVTTKETADSLILIFFDTMGYINDKLAEQKLKANRSKKSSVTGKTKSEMNSGVEQPKKITRTLSVGNGDKQIEFKSEKVPKPASETNVRHYSVATWKRRGTVRIYKNGKQVPIKEQICHRKGFNVSPENNDVPQSVLKVNKKVAWKKEESKKKDSKNEDTGKH